jgi:hypothetical protein
MKEPIGIGTSFARLTIIAAASPGTRGERYWWCLCDCGRRKRVRESHLRHNAIHSCGCLRVETSRRVNRTHGMTHVPEYCIYQGLKNRCSNPNDPTNYARYGARGIKCLWQTFEEFYAAMGPRPSPRHSIDRFPDTNGHYCTENARWATPREQALNKRHNHYLTLHGRTQTLSEWAEETGIHHTTILRRKGLGWTDEEALTTSPDIYKYRGTGRYPAQKYPQSGTP